MCDFITSIAAFNQIRESDNMHTMFYFRPYFGTSLAMQIAWGE